MAKTVIAEMHHKPSIHLLGTVIDDAHVDYMTYTI
jgi:hypothetical protein